MQSHCQPQLLVNTYSMVIIVLVMAGCAMKVAPTGGPRDMTAAEVVRVEPSLGTTLFDGDRVRFTFDDYVDRSIRNAFTILPSVRFTTSYSGDEITVEFQEPLAANTTYSVTLGTDWSDVRGNRPLASFTTIFSTGAGIDSGMISGLVSARSPESMSIFCYPLSDTSAPFTPWNAAPRYRLPCGLSGAFSVRGLADGTYRVMAVRDENRNGLVDPREEYAVAPADVVVRAGVAGAVRLKSGPAIDREPPELTRARSLTSQLLTVQFTESVYPVTTWEKAIEVRSASDIVVPVAAAWTDSSQRDRLLVRLTSSLDTGACRLSIAAGAMRDSAGNRNDSLQRQSFRGSSVADTLSLYIVSAEPRDSAKGVRRDQPLVISFSDAVDTMNAQVSVEHRSPQRSVQVRTRWASPVTFVIEPQEPRDLKTWYSTDVRLVNVRSALGRAVRDSVRMLAMLTEDRPVDPGSISGTFTPSDEMRSCSPLVIRLMSATGTVTAAFRADTDGRFRLDRVPAGEYTVDVFCDRNGNGVYDHGDLRPFAFGEAWWPLPTKISVRPRWTLENVSITP
jgi:hypothetical protein